MHPPHQLLLDLAADTASRPSHHCNPPPPGPPPGPPSLLVPPPNRCIPMCAKCSRIRLANWHHLSRALGRRHILMFLGDDGSIHALLACIVLPAIDVYYYYRSSVPIHYICRRLRHLPLSSSILLAAIIIVTSFTGVPATSSSEGCCCCCCLCSRWGSSWESAGRRMAGVLESTGQSSLSSEDDDQSGSHPSGGTSPGRILGADVDPATIITS